MNGIQRIENLEREVARLKRERNKAYAETSCCWNEWRQFGRLAENLREVVEELRDYHKVGLSEAERFRMQLSQYECDACGCTAPLVDGECQDCRDEGGGKR